MSRAKKNLKNVGFILIGPQENQTNVKRINGRDRSPGRPEFWDEPWYESSEAPSAFGIILHLSKIAPPANSVFTPEELKQRIELMAQHYEKELMMLGEEVERHKKSRKPRDERGDINEWVKILNCGGCKCILISKNQPALNGFKGRILHHKVKIAQRLAKR